MEKILVVCMGNICRSPIAEGLVRMLAARQGLSALVDIDSAGTHVPVAREPPDPRACRVAAKRGVSLTGLRSRQIVEDDFRRFDRILAMDRRNLEYLRRNCPEQQFAKLGLFLEYATGATTDEVPDPYYSSEQGFENVFDLCENAAHGLLRTIAQTAAQSGDST